MSAPLQQAQNDDRALTMHGIIREATQFVQAIGLVGLQRALHIFADYQKYLRQCRKGFRSRNLVIRTARSGEAIPLPGENIALREVYSIAQVAACCHLFRGWNIPLRVLQTGGFVDDVIDHAERLLSIQAVSVKELLTRLRITDALRSIQILKLTGLASVEACQWKQLSFGSGIANKELEGIHIIPKISLQKIAKHNRNNVTDYNLHFDINIVRPKNVVLIEKSEAVDELYDHLNSTQSHWILAINKDYNDAILSLPALQMAKDFGLRNAVVGIMIDPLLAPSIPTFLDLLCPVLAIDATLIITIGAGDNLSEFAGRLEFMKDLREYLQEKGLEPVAFRMYGGDSRQQQWSSPSFGVPPVATYEMLYCKVNRNKLQKN